MSTGFPEAHFRVEIAVVSPETGENAESIRIRLQKAIDEEFGAGYVAHL